MKSFTRSEFLRLTGTASLGLGGLAGCGRRVHVVPSPDVPNVPPAVFTDPASRLPGVVGDGLTDDQPALQLAISKTRESDELYLPPGNYLLGSPLYIGARKCLRLSGPGVLLVGGSEGIVINGASQNIHVQGLRFKALGNRATAVVFRGALHSKVVDCSFTGFYRGVLIDREGTNHDIHVVGNDIEAINLEGSIGISVLGPDNLISRNIIRGAETAMYVGMVSQLIEGNHSFCHPSAPGHAKYGLILGGQANIDITAKNILVVNNYFDTVSVAGVQVRGDCEGIHLQNNYFLSVDSICPFILVQPRVGYPYKLDGLIVTGNIFRSDGVYVPQSIVITSSPGTLTQVHVQTNSFFNVNPYRWTSPE